MRRRFVRKLGIAGASISLVLGGCAMLQGQLAGSAYDPRRLVPGLSGLTAGKVSPETAVLIQTVGPLAIEAVNALADAWMKQAAERREADLREEESRRQHTAEAQIFYADLCTTKGPAPEAKDPSTARADLAAKEKEAEAAFARADYASASALLQTVYDERKKTPGKNDPELARVANKLAVVSLAAGDGFRAMALATQGYEIRKKVLEPLEKNKAEFQKLLRANLDLSESETTIAQVYRASGAFDLAKKNAQHALEIRTKGLGNQHECVAQSQNDLGELEFLAGAYAPAEGLYKQSLAIRRLRLPPDHRDLAQSLNNLGSLYKAIALFAPAKEHYEKALENRRKLGEGHPEVADSYQNLASLYRAMGDFTLAESLYEKALAIRKAKFGDGLPVAETETTLAELYFSFGDYSRAEGLLVHALATRRARLPGDHPDLAESLADLARVHQAKGDFAKAEQNSREALSIQEKKFGPEHPVVASSLAALGELFLEQGQFDKAESSLSKALAIREKTLGADHPATAESLHLLGCLHYAKYDYARAEPLFRKAADMRRAKLGENHPLVAESLSYLAALLVAVDRPDEALLAFRSAQAISEQLLDSIGAMASEARLDAMLRFLRAQEEVVYSMLKEKTLSARAAPLALSIALLRKGRSVDGAASISQAVYRSLGQPEQQKFAELRILRGQIARQTLSPVGGVDPEETKRLIQKADQIEQELARSSALFRGRKGALTLDNVAQSVAKALPRDTVLVEVVKFRAYEFKSKPTQARWSGLRYAALVLDAKGGIKVADIGPASAVDEATKIFLKAITESSGASKAALPGAQARTAGQALDGLVMGPIRPFLAGAKGIVLSLDGQLNLIPFGALFDGKEYLIDQFDLTYVTSGRDLLPRPSGRRSTSVALLAKPAFTKGPLKSSEKSRGTTRGFDLVEGPDAAIPQNRIAPGALRLTAQPTPLPGTELEAKAIRRLLPKATLLLGAEATKDRFLGLDAPGILHVATHGLFRPEMRNDKGSGRGLATGNLLTPEPITNRPSDPLLSSMLLWANVSTPIQSENGAAVVLEPSGLATAFEVAGMNLWGTQLVVLSACETGRGHVDDLGQGVYGLRRAVMVAGAETLVTSLWKVDDDVTRQLMTAYYKGLLAGQGRGEALRRASLAIRKKYPDPIHWAPFIAIGQVGPLKGIK